MFWISRLYRRWSQYRQRLAHHSLRRRLRLFRLWRPIPKVPHWRHRRPQRHLLVRYAGTRQRWRPLPLLQMRQKRAIPTNVKQSRHDNDDLKKALGTRTGGRGDPGGVPFTTDKRTTSELNFDKSRSISVSSYFFFYDAK